MSATILPPNNAGIGTGVVAINFVPFGGYPSGYGYILTPNVIIGPPDAVGGTQAIAIVKKNIYGDLACIAILNPGSGYENPPSVSIDAPTGGGGSVQAVAAAVLASGNLMLLADARGYNYAIRQIPAAPAQSDMMVLYTQASYEGGVDAFGGIMFESSDTNYGWDARTCFGLSFDGVIPFGSTTKNFFGWMNGDPQKVRFTIDSLPSSPGGSNNSLIPSGNSIANLFYNGGTSGTAISNSIINYAASQLPANMRQAAGVTLVWVIKKDYGGQNIIVSLGINQNGYTISNISNALGDPLTAWIVQNLNINEPTNWRPSIGTMNFPTFFMMKFCGGIPGYKMLLNALKIEWWNFASGTIIGSN